MILGTILKILSAPFVGSLVDRISGIAEAYIKKEISEAEFRAQTNQAVVGAFAEVEKAWADAATKQYAEFQQTLRSSPVVQRAFVAVIVTQLIVLLWYQVGVPALVYLAGRPWPSAGATVEWAYLLLALCLGGGAYVFREPPDLTKLLR